MLSFLPVERTQDHDITPTPRHRQNPFCVGLDAGTAAGAGRSDTPLAAVDACDGSAYRRRQGARRAKPYKHGQRSRARQSLAVALRGQRHFVREMRVYARDKRNFPANELLNARAAALRAEGWNVVKSLALALAADQIMQKPCFLGPPAANS